LQKKDEDGFSLLEVAQQAKPGWLDRELVWLLRDAMNAYGIDETASMASTCKDQSNHGRDSAGVTDEE